jgi:Ni2+-binding GTPase involved in maturation of urease and hydrogenase
VKTIIVAGPPSAGKTAVIMHATRLLLQEKLRAAAVKFDTRSNADPQRYAARLGIPAIGGLSGYLCPDHYFIANMEEAVEWGHARRADMLFIETAGLCLRCAPHVDGLAAVTVIDCLGGLDAPVKMGPMLSLADVVVLTKGDLVSQAEREVLLHRVRRENPRAEVLAVNGLTGTGSAALLKWLRDRDDDGEVGDRRLRHDMPAAICSYCTGEKRIGQTFQSGNVEKLAWTEERP